MGHALHPKTTAETKSRLDKKHVEILEREFSKNQKPSSIVKRELAEKMGHEIARINNWFQNRRAKEKSNKRTAEYAAREANQQRDSSDRASSGSQSPKQQDEQRRDERSALDDIQRRIMSRATIGEVEPEDHDSSEQPQFQGELDGTPDDSSPCPDDDMSNSSLDNTGLVVVVSHDLPNHGDTRDQFQPPNPDFKQAYNYPTLRDFASGLPQGSINNLEYLDDNEIATAWFHPLPQAPSDYFGSEVAPLSLLNAGAPMAMTEQFPSEDVLKGQQLASPVSMSSMSRTPPPAKDPASRFALKSPRPINIAARRNHQRPAPLGLTVSRNASYCQGPKTGIDVPRRRADEASPMRRTASASGLRRLPTRVSEGLRSPGTNFQMVRSPSYNSSASPVSPGRADTPATNNSDDNHGLPYANFNAPMATRFENPINTPPVTPGLPLGYSSFGNPFEQAWANAANDQPLATPSLCSHGGSEMDFPATTSHMPNYIASQPTTPGFQRPDAFGPGFRFLQGGMSNAPEYTFPDSSFVESSLASSPHEQQMSSKTFQFAQNVTPQDFSAEN